MTTAEKIIARIGMVNYINTAPFYEVWKESVHEPSWYVEEAAPATLNRMLAAGELDLGMVSCYEYCARPEQYRILADLSISANGPVGSVFLFSHRPLAELDGAQVLLSSQSATSVALTKVILEEFAGVRPSYVSGEVTGPLADSCQAVLAIGDDALRLSALGQYRYRLDLGEIWKEHTGMPFVFAVFAIREEFCLSSPAVLAAIQAQLFRCREEGRVQLQGICERVAPRIPMTAVDCHAYLKGIEYDLGPAKQQALTRFFQYLIKRGEAEASALPLKIYQPS